MIKLIKHPLIDVKLTIMRDHQTDHTAFRDNLQEIASLMVYEIMRDYVGRATKVKTPTGAIATGKKLGQDIVLVPILRAGLGMLDGIVKLIPQAKIGHVGVYRNETTFDVVSYFYKLPVVARDAQILVLDPMVATGTSAATVIGKLKQDGFSNIKLIALVGVQEGLDAIKAQHPDVNIYLVAIDQKLDASKYIQPGLGDAGDRIFGTK